MQWDIARSVAVRQVYLRHKIDEHKYSQDLRNQPRIARIVTDASREFEVPKEPKHKAAFECGSADSVQIGEICG